MVWSKKLRKFGLAAAIFLIGIILAQLVWPQRLTPFSSWNEKYVGFLARADLAKLCEQKTADSTIVVAGQSSIRKYATTKDAVGASIDCGEFAEHAVDYKWYRRLIPFSVLVPRSIESPRLKVNNQEKFNKKTESIADYLKLPSKNAEVLLEEGSVKVVDEEDGLQYSSNDISNALLSADLTRPSETKASGSTIAATIDSDDIKPTVEKINQILEKGFVFTANNKKHSVPRESFGDWIVVKSSPEVSIEYKKEQIERYLIETKAAIAKDTDVNNIATAETAEAAVKSLQQNTASAQLMAANSRVIAPINATPESLNAYIQQLSSRGESIAVIFKKVGDQQIFSVNSERVYTAASTYKLFVAYSVMKRIDAGQLSWGAPFAGTTVGNCFDKMIVLSDNSCAEAFLSRFGFSTVAAEGRSLGAGTVSFSPGNMRVSANDLAVLLEKLGNGSLVSSGSMNRLLGVMQRQVYRRGIPAGSSYQVADKVGFLYALLHDAALIDTPNGRYVAVIMTDRSSWGRIAELTRMLMSLI